MTLVPPFLLAGRYHITDEIGRGGHAIVFRARDAVLNRDVAVKMLRDDVLEDDIRQRFLQEVQVTAHLEHAHILHVYDTGEQDGQPWIVMELSSGRTLRDRMNTERQLPVDDALFIARDIGMALSHAHSHGVVHRDVKPENILLGSGGAILADFGIARVAAELAVTRPITDSGTAVGTVRYMSPEQLCAEPNIDARSDQYALACVLYEMLAGVGPHVASTVEGLRMLRVSGQQSPVNLHRPSLRLEIATAIMQALAAVPADRFRNMSEFLAALQPIVSGNYAVVQASGLSAVHSEGKHTPRPEHQPASIYEQFITDKTVWATRRTYVVGALSIAALITLVAVVRPWSSNGLGAHVDGMVRVSLAATSTTDNAVTEPPLREALRQELGAWNMVLVVDKLSASDTAALLLRPTMTTLGDSVRIQVALSRANGSLLPPATMIVAATALQAPSVVVAELVRRVLLQYVEPDVSPADVPGLHTLPGRSLPVLRAYVSGFSALRRGRLDSAMASFQRAASGDAGFPYADFWAAQSGAWGAPLNLVAWRANAERALLGDVRGSGLRGVDSLLAVALSHMSQGAFPAACDAYRESTQVDRRSFVAWYGLGECQRLDSLVVRGPGGMRFRSSHWAALDAYQRAIELAPTPQWLNALFDRMLVITYAGGSKARAGHTGRVPRDSLFALPSLLNDTIGFIPLSPREFGGSSKEAVPSTFAAALRRGQAVALAMTSRWTTRFPNSVDGWLQRAYVLEIAGKIAPSLTPGVSTAPQDVVSADDALDRAGALQPSMAMQARIGVARTRLALRRGDIAGAVALAHSATALASLPNATPDVRSTLAPLAALLGDRELLTQLRVGDRDDSSPLQAELVDSLRSFTMRATIGACDGLELSRDALESMFRNHVASAERNAMRIRFLRPALRAAVPCLDVNALRDFTPEHPLDFAFQALATGDAPSARRILETLRNGRGGATIASISWDYLFVESWALARAGDTVAARAQLVGALTNIAGMSTFTLELVPQAAGFRRGMLLLRELNAGKGTQAGELERMWVVKATELISTNQ